MKKGKIERLLACVLTAAVVGNMVFGHVSIATASSETAVVAESDEKEKSSSAVSPEISQTPAPTESPQPTESPEPTKVPTPSVTPAPTAEPTQKPEPTKVPTPSVTPAPTAVPTLTPTVTPAPVIQVDIVNIPEVFYAGCEYKLGVNVTGAEKKTETWSIEDSDGTVSINQDGTLTVSENSDTESVFSVRVTVETDHGSVSKKTEIFKVTRLQLDEKTDYNLKNREAGDVSSQSLGGYGQYVTENIATIGIKQGYIEYQLDYLNQSGQPETGRTSGWTQISQNSISVGNDCKYGFQFVLKRNDGAISNPVVIRYDLNAPQITKIEETAYDGKGKEIEDIKADDYAAERGYKITAVDGEGETGISENYYCFSIEKLDKPISYEGFCKMPDKIRFCEEGYLYVYTKDKAGHNSEITEIKVSNIDKTPPEIHVARDNEAIKNEAVIWLKKEQNQVTFNVSAKDDRLESFVYQIDGSEPEQVPSDGKIDMTFEKEDQPVSSKLTITATDKCKNESVFSVTVQYDPISPEIDENLTGIYVDNVKISSDTWISMETLEKKTTKLKVNATDEPENSKVEKAVYWIGEDDTNPKDIVKNEDGEFALDLGTILAGKVSAGGEYQGTLYVAAVDTAGNESNKLEFGIKVDANAPDITVPVEVIPDYYNSSNLEETNEIVVKVNGGSSGIKKITYKKNDEEKEEELKLQEGVVKIPIQADKAENEDGYIQGEYTYTVICIDGAGNQGTAAFSVNWDTIAPEINGLSITDKVDDKDTGVFEKLSEKIKEFFTGKESVYVSVKVTDNGSGVDKVTGDIKGVGENIEFKFSSDGVDTKTGDSVIVYKTEVSVKESEKKELYGTVTSITASDKAGNINKKYDFSEEETANFVIDQEPPKLEVSYESCELKFTDSNGVDYYYTYYEGAPQEHQLNLKLTLTEEFFLRQGETQYKEDEEQKNHYGSSQESVQITQYSYDKGDSDGKYAIISESSAPIQWTRETNDPDKYEATISLDPGYRYCITYSMQDAVGNSLTGDSIKDGKYCTEFVVLPDEPELTSLKTSIGSNSSNEPVYTNQPFTITGVIKQELFPTTDKGLERIKLSYEKGKKKFEILLREDTPGDTPVLSWQHNDNEHTFTYKIGEDNGSDGEYRNFSLTYQWADPENGKVEKENEFSSPIILDQTAPELTEFDITAERDHWNSKEGKAYYSTKPIEGKVVIKEKNFDATKISLSIVSADGGEEIKIENPPDVTWTWENDKDDIHTGTFTISWKKGQPADGDYRVKITGSDLAKNGLVDSREERKDEFRTDEIVVIDTIEMQIEAALNDGYQEDKETKKKYYKTAPELTLVVTEHNFNPANINVEMDISNLPSGSDLDVEKMAYDIQEYFKNAKWEDDGDIHTATYTFADRDDVKYDADYKITGISGKDWAGNGFVEEKVTSAINTVGTFVIDTTEMQIEAALNNGYQKDEETEKKYYRTAPELKLVVTEHNFNPANMVVTMVVSNPPSGINSGLNDQETKIKNFFSKKENWDVQGEDTYIATYQFKGINTHQYDADYKITGISGQDWAGNGFVKEEVTSAINAVGTFVIDTIKPEISMEYDKSNTFASPDLDTKRNYSKTQVQLQFTVKEHNFKPERIIAGMESLNALGQVISAKELQEQLQENRWRQSEDDKDTYTLAVTFTTESNYKVYNVQLTDLAGNAGSDGKTFEFTVDGTDPVIDDFTVENHNGRQYNDYHYISKEPVRVYANTSDWVAGIYDVAFKATDINGKVYEKTMTVSKPEGVWNKQAYIDLTADFKGTVEATVRDYAGNTSSRKLGYGVIVEGTSMHDSTSSLSIKADRQPNEHGFYNSDVTVTIDMADTYSGLHDYDWYTAISNEKAGSSNGTSELKDTSNYTITNTLSANEYNSNHVSVHAKFQDNAGHDKTVDPYELKIDNKAPVVTITYDNNDPANGKYYNKTRTATVTVKERNFDADRVNFKWTSTGAAPSISGWSHSSNAGESDEAVHTATVTFSADADYTFTFNCTDLADNKSNEPEAQSFTVDQTKPKIEVKYDNNDVKNGKYYSKERTATITITEHNFNASDVKTAITAALEGKGTDVPSVSGFSNSGDTHTATVHYSKDADYTFDIEYTDMAANPAEKFTKESFTVDKTKPEISIFDIKNKSANNGKVAPGVKYTDANYDANSVKITLKGVNHGAMKLTGNRTNLGNGESIKMADFKHTQDMDDLYTLTAEVADKAGNADKKSVMFSVNRFGSVYVLSEETKKLVDDYYTNQEQELVVREINVDTLKFKEITYGRDGTLVTLENGKDYTVKESGTDASWKEYEYRIKKENFAEEGVYSVTISSEDRAKNTMNNKIKKKEINFVVDKTKPTVVITGIEDGKQYRENTRDITVTVQDNIAVGGVDIYVGDSSTPAASYDAEMVEASNGVIPVTLESANSFQQVYAKANDAAGNSENSKKFRVLISSNLLVQYFNNKPLFIGSIIGLLAIIGVIIILVKRRKAE